ncbi:AAA family ATPase [Flavobacterium sp.]|uniref:McrB family protein n=1 Tax=Flavobacterium sp. TaxID=239 RepID=UPI00286CF275|nr:AAA family ATPase [Flavobacterium sp.]
MAFKPNDITKEHVFKAIEKIESESILLKLPTRWEVIINDKNYPPKEVMRYAHEQMNGEKIWNYGGGEATNKYLKKMSFSFIDKHDDPIKEIISKYKKYISKDGLRNEIYKWDLLSQFQGRPNVDAVDFAAEINTVKFANLIYPVGQAVVKHLAAAKTVEYRDCFKILFDESIDLKERIDYFDKKTLEVYRQIVPEVRFSHHQDERTISTFLTFHNPNKYTFYKDSFYQKYCKLIGIKPKKKGEKLIHYLALIDDFVNEYINDDLELVTLVKSKLPPTAFKDDSHKLLAQDILYQMLDKGIEEVDIENYAVYKISMGDFSNDEMKYFLENNKICVHKLTKAKGISTISQGDIFENKINIGDYFYLTQGNGNDRMKLIGRITSSSTPPDYNDYGDEGWLARDFEIVATSKNKSQYTGANKWWTPNNNSTCIEIKREELTDANKLLFEPYFMTRLFSSAAEEKSEETDKPNSLINMTHPLNQILYGPPGTGKTYNSINKAISIINPTFDSTQKRFLVKEEYERLVLNNQISFATFHQSMSYEDFIEGIKPVLSDENEEALNYEIKDGLFKIACANAAYLCYKKYQQSKTKIEKYSFDDLHDAFIDNIWKLINEQNPPIYKTLTGKDVIVLDVNKNDSIRARAKNSTAKKKPAPLTKENLQKLYDKFSSIDEIKNLKQVKETVEITPRITEFYAVFKGLKEFEKDFEKTLIPETDFLDENNEVDSYEVDEIIRKFNAGVYKNAIKEFGKNAEPVILIIDEINRGNVSQIFGELITLIEEDKRLGKDEALEITLPYSKEKFSVPPNLYIIGTMNTADRSVEALDSALRRRFCFEEMPPRYDLKGLEGEVYGYFLKDILETINKRIVRLLNYDHAIGHSYFLNKNEDTIIESFYKNIIPLLQEYFFGDYGKMMLVLGEGFVSYDEWKDDDKFFASNSDSKNDYDVKDLYSIQDHQKDNDAFKAALQKLMNK